MTAIKFIFEKHCVRITVKSSMTFALSIFSGTAILNNCDVSGFHYSDTQDFKAGHHFFPSLKLTFPFIFKLYDVQSTLNFKSTSTKQRF